MRKNCNFRRGFRRVRPPTRGSTREGPLIAGFSPPAMSSGFIFLNLMAEGIILPELVKRRWGEPTIRNDLTWLKQAEAMADWEFFILPPWLPPGLMTRDVITLAQDDSILLPVKIPESLARDWIIHTCTVDIKNKQRRDKDISGRGLGPVPSDSKVLQICFAMKHRFRRQVFRQSGKFSKSRMPEMDLVCHA